MLLGTAFAVSLTVVVIAYRKAPLIEDAPESPSRERSRRRKLSVSNASRFLRSGRVAGRVRDAGVNLSVR